MILCPRFRFRWWCNNGRHSASILAGNLKCRGCARCVPLIFQTAWVVVIVVVDVSNEKGFFSSRSPTRSPWSCEPTRWWTCPPCTSGWIRRPVRTSNRALSCNNHNKCQPLHAGLSVEHALRLGHSRCSPQNWTGRLGLGCLGNSWRSARHDWQGEPWKWHHEYTI